MNLSRPSCTIDIITMRGLRRCPLATSELTSNLVVTLKVGEYHKLAEQKLVRTSKCVVTPRNKIPVRV